ncbi:hypothetical protein HD806DRAFT_74728 [Xylariaceae sp. AK1471]|nr:hypothetical protein HD806DRAFT_74728 [Xylariaceae sp. AK1471]
MSLQSFTNFYVSAPGRNKHYEAILDSSGGHYYDDDKQDGDDNTSSPRKTRQLTWKLVHICFTVLNCTLFLVLVGRLFSQGSFQTNLAFQYKSTYFKKDGHLNSKFSKKPGQELDEAWHDLLAGMNIKVSGEWVEKFGAQSVRFADGSGILAQLGIYHDLHCLKKLKHWNFRSYYHANLTNAEIEEEEYHIEHCLEWLRVAALCRGDTTLTTLHWGGGPDRTLLQTEYPIPRQCVDSERILAWSEERAVDITEEGLLERA